MSRLRTIAAVVLYDSVLSVGLLSYYVGSLYDDYDHVECNLIVLFSTDGSAQEMPHLAA
jgi:hypothetical protein